MEPTNEIDNLPIFTSPRPGTSTVARPRSPTYISTPDRPRTDPVNGHTNGPAAMLSDPIVTTLGPDPAHRSCKLNATAFQQDAITSCRGWQYAVFCAAQDTEHPEPLCFHLARRCLPAGAWETFVFDDYPQTTDDGHNTAQVGVCEGDGTIHISYDHHCDILRYRISVRNLALTPTEFTWSASLFTPTLDYLPGFPSTHTPFHYVTYPRFGPLTLQPTPTNPTPSRDLFCTFRDGKAGLGSDHLYIYSSARGHFLRIGTYLTGTASNPYVHGLDCRDGKLHVTWVWRGFVEYEGWDDPADTKHKQQAGPNGAENNHDLCYAWSEDGGREWRNSSGDVIARVKDGGEGEELGTIGNASEGITVVRIPKSRGLTNQESQAIDPDGGVHVLNRQFIPGWGKDLENGGLDKLHAFNFYRDPSSGIWRAMSLCALNGPARGRVAVSKGGDRFTIIPDPVARRMDIYRATKAGNYMDDMLVWTGEGLLGEPLVDVPRLEADGIMSVFALQLANEPKREQEARDIVVMDFTV